MQLGGDWCLAPQPLFCLCHIVAAAAPRRPIPVSRPPLPKPTPHFSLLQISFCSIKRRGRGDAQYAPRVERGQYRRHGACVARHVHRRRSVAGPPPVTAHAKSGLCMVESSRHRLCLSHEHKCSDLQGQLPGAHHDKYMSSKAGLPSHAQRMCSLFAADKEPILGCRVERGGHTYDAGG